METKLGAYLHKQICWLNGDENLFYLLKSSFKTSTEKVASEDRLWKHANHHKSPPICVYLVFLK